MPPYEKSMEITPFKQRKCLATRKDEVCTIRSKFPNKLPVIVERYPREKKLPLLDKTKFLVPHELTLGQFLSLLRSKIELEASQALYLLISGKKMSCLSASMGEVYSQFRDPDDHVLLLNEDSPCASHLKPHRPPTTLGLEDSPDLIF
uniref:Microtubule-associated protein 1 light chain 3 gamma, like n=1 Tax=Cyprinus carpio carpio TaxID=630221 RepID=A0A8C1AFY0_CYPCA